MLKNQEHCTNDKLWVFLLFTWASCGLLKGSTRSNIRIINILPKTKKGSNIIWPLSKSLNSSNTRRYINLGNKAPKFRSLTAKGIMCSFKIFLINAFITLFQQPFLSIRFFFRVVSTVAYTTLHHDFLFPLCPFSNIYYTI